MSKYCCFFCPKPDSTQKELSAPCPQCSRGYDFPLRFPPKAIGEYRILESKGRGFYGATYVAERGFLKIRCVLKITPVALYDHFKKDFQAECVLHAKLAEGASHIVAIRSAFDETVVYSDPEGTAMHCHVAELDFVRGELLRDYINGEALATAPIIGQIAIDLLNLRAELEEKELNHNDLHAENLIVEQLHARRADGALDDSIRLKAIDLGSVSDASKSDTQLSRTGDLSWMANHIELLLERFLSNPDIIDDKNNRIALALQSVVHGMAASPEMHRLPDTSDLVEQIKESFYRAINPWKPWRSPLSLRNFGEHYNAQTLDSWNAPALLVDPGGHWMREVSKPGPQIITGMRGCGKTLLLRSLEFHARANQLDEPIEQVLDRLKSDKFVGLFVWAQRLLDLKEGSLLTDNHRLTRLFIHFGLQTVRALFHLRDLDSSAVSPGAHEFLARGIGDYLDCQDSLSESTSLDDLERRVEKLAVAITRQHDAFAISGTAADVFSHLAEQIRRCAAIWSESTVLFLLDDVSTRYLDLEKVENVLSSLLFSNPICAFKFTSEWQTIELGLKSPGRNHPVRIDRDLSLFDLGAEVYRTITQKGKGHGSEFVEEILAHRAKYYAFHPPEKRPSELLGSVPLETIAREIANSSESSKQRKEVYRGMTCLARVCVGDIGDVIKLYDEIIKRWSNQGKGPIPQRIQSECFQDLSSRRLYDLNRRAGYFKDNAKTFAEASHELLVRSYRDADDKLKVRLRQYTSIYVRITTENEESTLKQIDRLRELIDAGVFVFAGGAPRTKTKDSNPIRQFKLSYRKIYGLANYIGLAERDRFELSGEELAEWLEHPERGKEILLRNLGGVEPELEYPDSEEDSSDEPPSKTQDVSGIRASQRPSPRFEEQDLFAAVPTAPETSSSTEDSKVLDDSNSQSRVKPIPVRINFELRELKPEELVQLGSKSVLTGLGFEERTLASNKFLSQWLTNSNVYAVKYDLAGFSKQILQSWEEAKSNLVIVDYSDLREPNNIPDSEVIDISGLPKPVIFYAVRQALIKHKRVVICYAEAEHSYPLKSDLDQIMQAETQQDPDLLLSSLSGVLKGEKGPYEPVALLSSGTDESRERALIAFPSPKHERIFALLDNRDYERIEVLSPEPNNPRARVSQIAGELIAKNYPNTHVSTINLYDLAETIKVCDEFYLALYALRGYNLEVSLTGSKLQTVAVAVLSAARHVPQAWYVRPKEFDENRFTSGTRNIKIFQISLKDSVSQDS